MAAPRFLSLSGNEITDASRIAAHSWSISQSGGGQTDGLTDDGSLFIGRAATNLFPHGQDDSTSNWQTSTGGVLITLDATVPAPFAPQSVKYVTDGSLGGQSCHARTPGGLAAAAGTMGAGSVWFNGVAGATYQVNLRWSNTDATSNDGVATVFVATGDWQLLTPASVAVAAGKIGDFLGILPRIVAGVSRAETFYVAHAMLESGQSVVAPYVPTSGGVTATKPAARVQAPASLLNATQGAVAIRVAMGYASSADTASRGLFGWGNATDRLVLYYNGGDANKCWQFARQAAGVGGAISVAQAFSAGDEVTVIAAWDAEKVKLSVNGGAFVPLADAHVPVGLASLFDIGALQLGGFPCDSWVKWAATFTGTLTDQDAANIAASGNVTPHGTIPSGAQCTGMFPFPGYGNKSDSIRIA